MSKWMIKAHKLAKSFEGKIVFEGAQIEIVEGEHAALFGPNGVGKTTLLRLLAGYDEPDEGTIHRGIPTAEWGWMDQQLDVQEHISLLHYVRSGQGELMRLKDELDKLQEQMGDHHSVSSLNGSMEECLERYGQCLEHYENLGGYAWEQQVEKILTSLDLREEAWQRPFVSLSGGQKTRAQLAKLLVQEPRMMLLDEPTNHLDRASLEWLERWLQEYKGTVLIVSHDRRFLDAAAHSIIELTRNGTKKYKGGYSDFREQRRLEIQAQQKQYEKQEKERKQLTEMIRGYREWYHTASSQVKTVEVGIQKSYFAARANKHTSRLRAKEKQLERLDQNRMEKPREASTVHMEFANGAFAARVLIRAEQVKFAYPEQPPLFEGLQLYLNRGDRLAVTGPNGAGKSTLLKLLTGEIEPLEGSVILHPQLVAGYFAQQLEGLNTEETILDSLLSIPNMTQTYARTILGCFLFRREDVYKRIGDLSMGEKCRVAFVKLYFSGANMLVLDEPTNYLDIDTSETIEEALLAYPGTLVIVSHDRYLVGKVANRIVDLEDGRVQMFEGTADQFEQHALDVKTYGETPGRQDEIKQLELKLVYLMGVEEPKQTEEKQRLLEQIRQTRKELDRLRVQSS